jgi:hypothetical protein
MNQTARAVLLGLAAGIVSGMFGVGGGVVVVPGLVLWMELDQRRAAATSIATITASAGAALLLFGRASAVNWSAAAYLLIGATVGAAFAARVLDRVSNRILTWAFAALLLISAARLGLGS